MKKIDLLNCIASYNENCFIIFPDIPIVSKNGFVKKDELDTFFHETTHHFNFTSSLFCLQNLVYNYALAYYFSNWLQEYEITRFPIKKSEIAQELKEKLNIYDNYNDLYGDIWYKDKSIPFVEIDNKNNLPRLIFKNKKKYKIGAHCILEYIGRNIDEHFIKLLKKDTFNFQYFPYLVLDDIFNYYITDCDKFSKLLIADYSLQYDNPGKKIIELIQEVKANKIYNDFDKLKNYLFESLTNSKEYNEIKKSILADIDIICLDQTDTELKLIFNTFKNIVSDSVEVLNNNNGLPLYFLLLKNDILNKPIEEILQKLAPIIIADKFEHPPFVVMAHNKFDSSILTKAYLFMFGINHFVHNILLEKKYACPLSIFCADYDFKNNYYCQSKPWFYGKNNNGCALGKAFHFLKVKTTVG